MFPLYVKMNGKFLYEDEKDSIKEVMWKFFKKEENAIEKVFYFRSFCVCASETLTTTFFIFSL